MWLCVCVCKNIFNLVKVYTCCCKIFKGLTFFWTHCISTSNIHHPSQYYTYILPYYCYCCCCSCCCYYYYYYYYYYEDDYDYY